MTRRPAPSARAITSTLRAMMSVGLQPGAVRCLADGTFEIQCGGKPVAANDDLDTELAAFEARHGQD